MPLRELRVVIASPSDVNEERQAAREVISELNSIVAHEHDLVLRPYMWETDAHPGFNDAGVQGIIDPILKIEDSDIVVGIFWRRFGTPTSSGETGTEHELRAALQSWKEKKKPEIMVYFREAPANPTVVDELEQWRRVLVFKQEFFGANGLRWSYTDPATFKDNLRNHLTAYIYRQRSLFDTKNSKTSIQYLRDLDAYTELCDLSKKALASRSTSSRSARRTSMRFTRSIRSRPITRQP